MAGKHSRRRKTAGTLSKAAAATAAFGVVSAAPAFAASAFTVRGTDILSPGDSPETIVPGIFAVNPAGMFFDNVVLAAKAGCPISLLMCKHFPQVSARRMLAEHIRANAG